MRVQFRAVTAIVSSLFLLAALTACPGPQKKPEPVPQKPDPGNQQISVVPPPPPATTPAPQLGGVVPPIKALPPIELPKAEVPKFGVILGPGGMKTWAHIGVLRQFQQHRIPISHIVGIEWGAYIGALYAKGAQPNEVEWQSMKIKDSEISGTGLFDRKVKRRNINILESAFARTLGDSHIESGKIDYACPTTQTKSEKNLWQNRGMARGVMARCVSYPPFFTDSNSYLAATFSLEDASTWLRARGAQVIIFVDVLSSPEIFSKSEADENYVENLLWTELRRSLHRGTHGTVHHVVSVNTSAISLVDVSARRRAIEIGQSSSGELLRQIARRYGL